MGDAIGPELMALVHHLYRKKSSADEALAELTLRTREKCERTDVQMAPTAKEIAYTRWFASMKGRYKSLRDDLQRRPEMKEAEDVMTGLYPNGCSVAQVVDAFSTATDMLTFRIPTASVMDAASQRSSALAAKNVSRLTAKDLAKEYCSAVVLPALIPPRWWEVQPDAAKRTMTQLLAIGLRTEPPSLVLEYSRTNPAGAKKRHRAIYLHEDLNPTGSVVALSKRLAATHGALVSEVEFQKYLLRLQKLMREGPPPPETKIAPSAGAAATTAPVHSSSSAESKQSASGNKADLGLLYRDPEAALKDVDLQDADEYTVKEFKAKMDETFVTKMLKPGDPGYQYDRRVEFVATNKSEWDEDEDDDDDEF